MKTAKTLVIQSDGTFEIRDVPIEYPAFNQAVLGGGYVQAMYTLIDDRRFVFSMDEEGKFKGLPPNHVATRLWYALGGAQLLPGDIFCGPVGVNTVDGEELSDVPYLDVLQEVIDGG
jgi:hypothetical protein